jgi:hypothetical protein
MLKCCKKKKSKANISNVNKQDDYDFLNESELRFLRGANRVQSQVFKFK